MIPQRVWRECKSEPQRADWGKNHPDYGKKEKKTGKQIQRAAWTDDEKAYIAEWCCDKVQSNPESINAIVSSCLKHMQQDSKALPIFHHLHVVDAARLRHGYRKALQDGFFPSDYAGLKTEEEEEENDEEWVQC